MAQLFDAIGKKITEKKLHHLSQQLSGLPSL